jgi:hypothetical protein
MNITDNITQDIAVPKSADNQRDIEAIASVIQVYTEGGRRGDAAIMQRAFRKNATIHGYIGGGLLAGPIQMLFDWVTENPPAPNLDPRIAQIDIAETIATARVEITDWLGFRFTDQFTLLKENGEWIITSKVFHTY